MPLSSDLLSQFAKSTKDTSKTKSESTVYGTIVEYDGGKYIMIDGSELLTPISSTAKAMDNDRVTAIIKNHSVIVTGNLTSPAPTDKEMTDLNGEVTDFKTVVADDIKAVRGDFNLLEADYAQFGQVTTEKLNAVYGMIENLDVDNLDAKYANIEFANITEAAIREFFTKSGMIENVTIGDATVTGALVSTTIKGDIIEAGTLKADKLIVRGTDGLYYKLNVDENGAIPEGVTEEDIEKLKNGLHGSHIIAQSITADKMSVSDLSAFEASIGGFKLDSDAIRSVDKPTATAGTQGIYMSNDGQFAVGDNDNYIKYYKDTDDTYKLAISANTMIFGSSGKIDVNELADNINGFHDSIEGCYEYVNGAVDEVSSKIVGRNLIRGSKDFALDDDQVDGWFDSEGVWTFTEEDGYTIASCSVDGELKSSLIPLDRGESIVISYWLKVDDADLDVLCAPCKISIYDADYLDSAMYMRRLLPNEALNNPVINANEWVYLYYTFTIDNVGAISWIEHPYMSIDLLSDSLSDGTISFKKFKVEKGTVPTEWSAAPEDQDAAIDAAQDSADGAQDSVDSLANKVATVETTIQQLEDSISMLVQGVDGSSLMKQTDKGWVFDISSIQRDIADVKTDIDDLDGDITEADGLIDNLDKAIGEYHSYITFGVDNGQPCIILGADTSDFKVKITNTSIKFMEGSVTPAYINNQSLNVSKAVISNELKQGNFVWMARANGNYGLLWRGE